VFLAALLRKAEALPSFQCWMGARVSSLMHENGKCAGVTGIRHGKEPFEVRADVVIGADGRYSAVARMGGFRNAYAHHDFDLIWFSIEKPAGWPDTLHISLGGEVGGLMLPKWPHHVQVGIALKTGVWKEWRRQGIGFVAERIRRFDETFVSFADGLKDFTPFVPLEGLIRLVDDWARDGLLLIGDAAHTMSPAGAIGVNVAIATAVVAAQELYPRLGRGPIPHADLQNIQRLREPDVRALHRLQMGAQQIILGNVRPLVRRVLPVVLPLALHSPLATRIQRRVFFGVPLPPLDPAFRFREPLGAAASTNATAKAAASA
jgi:2-polyprenyl-6-methoxyphenol hydroxylase-like FAD-dependent oxidoreductase